MKNLIGMFMLTLISVNVYAQTMISPERCEFNWRMWPTTQLVTEEQKNQLKREVEVLYEGSPKTDFIFRGENYKKIDQLLEAVDKYNAENEDLSMVALFELYTLPVGGDEEEYNRYRTAYLKGNWYPNEKDAIEALKKAHPNEKVYDETTLQKFGYYGGALKLSIVPPQPEPKSWFDKHGDEVLSFSKNNLIYICSLMALVCFMSVLRSSLKVEEKTIDE